MNWLLLTIGIILVIVLMLFSILIYKVVKTLKNLEKKYPYLFDKGTKNKSKAIKK